MITNLLIDDSFEYVNRMFKQSRKKKMKIKKKKT